MYDCVRTITTIYPSVTLLDAAAASISRFIASDNHNLKYVGVTGLAAIVKVRDCRRCRIFCEVALPESARFALLLLCYRRRDPMLRSAISKFVSYSLSVGSSAFTPVVGFASTWP